jgi:antitoxin component YwqK of YwqJK toxin-antitoxin module
MKKVKQKAKFIILLTICSLASYAQNVVNALDEKGLRHGPWKGYYEDSKILRYEGNFNHGKEIGTFTYNANSDKKIVMATRTFDNKNNAYTIFFDEKNFKVSEGNVINKLREGIWKYYHKESSKIMTTENYVHDKLQGIRKVFYLDGKTAEEVKYSNNVREGISKKYSEKGILIEESTFYNDKLQGSYKVYDGSGKLVIKGQFKNDKKNGIWQYFKNGKLIKEENKDIVKKSEASEKRKKNDTVKKPIIIQPADK